MYHALHYYNFSRSNLRPVLKAGGLSEFKAYRAFARIGGDFQRGMARQKEFGGVVYKEGTVDRVLHLVGSVIEIDLIYYIPVIPTKFFYHTHWARPGTFYWDNLGSDEWTYITRYNTGSLFYR